VPRRNIFTRLTGLLSTRLPLLYAQIFSPTDPLDQSTFSPLKNFRLNKDVLLELRSPRLVF